MATPQVNTIARNRAEVVTARARYVIQADETSFVLQAFKGKRSVERVALTHKGDNYSLAGVGGAGQSQRRTMRFKGNRVVSRGVFGGRPFSVSSSVCSYIPLLAAKLNGRKPIRLPLIAAFMSQFKRDGRLRAEVEKRVDTAMMLRAPNAVVIACVIICAECFFTGDLLACTLCDLCLKPDPGK
jgi:hypothetical protein